MSVKPLKDNNIMIIEVWGRRILLIQDLAYKIYAFQNHNNIVWRSLNLRWLVLSVGI